MDSRNKYVIVCYPELATLHTSLAHAVYVTDAEHKANVMQKRANKLDRQIQRDYQRVQSAFEAVEAEPTQQRRG